MVSMAAAGLPDGETARGHSVASEMNGSPTNSSTHSFRDGSYRDDALQALTPQRSHTSQPPLSRKVTSVRTTATSDLEFEVDWDGPDDPENPRNWPVWYKGMAIGIMSWSTCVVVLYSTSYTTGIGEMEEDFQIYNEPIITLGLTVYLVGLAIGCMVLAPVSEMYGRKPVYVITMICFIVLLIPAGLADSLTEILIDRFFAALAASALIANAPGTLSDIVSDEYRSLAFSVWSIGPLNGPVLGPVIGGFVSQYKGFRWTNWLVMMFAGVALLFLCILKETYSPALLNKRAKLRRKETDDSRWWSRYEQRVSFLTLLRINLTRPVVMALTEPICIFWNLYIATIYGILYLCFVAYPIVFGEIRGWSVGLSGLAFIGVGIGSTLIIFMEPLIRRMVNAHKKNPDTGKVTPEASVSIICIAAFLAPLGQLWFAWTCAPPVHWVWPILAGIPFGAGNSAVFIYSSSYLGGAYGIYTASAMAGNAVVRSLLGGTLPLAGPAMYRTLGPHWAGTILGLIQIAIIPIPLVFYRYGGKIREKSVLITRMREDQERQDGKRRKHSLTLAAAEKIMEEGREEQKCEDTRPSVSEKETQKVLPSPEEKEIEVEKKNMPVLQKIVETVSNVEPTDTRMMASAGGDKRLGKELMV